MSPQSYITRFSLKAFLVLEKEVLSVLPYMGMAAILFNGVEQFEQIANTLSTEGPLWNLVKIGLAVSEKRTYKDYTNLYMYIA